MDNREETPTERTTLLAKNESRLTTAASSASSVDPIDHPNMFTTTSVGFLALWKKCRFYLIEPTVLILVFAYNLSATVLKNQIIYQTCTVIYQYNSTDCRKLSTKNTSDYIKSIETEIQPYTAVFFMTNSILQSIVPALCGTFVGAWSDRFGRKPLLIASFIGYFLFYALTYLISRLSESFDVSPWYYVIPSIPLSLLGDGVTYSVAAFCYISDVSTAKERPYRMTLYEAVIYIGLMLGSLSSGFIYDNYKSASLIFLISTVCIFCATIIVIFLIPESLNARRSTETLNSDHGNTKPAENQSSQQHQEVNVASTPNRFRNLFDIEHIRKMYETCFKFREYEMRSVILLILTCLWTCAFVLEGSTTVFYLFVREKFQWTVKDFTTYESLSILVPILGNVIGIWLLRKVFKVQLLKVAILGLLSQTCCSFMKGFATVNWQLYVAIALGILKSIVNPMLRTVLTNILPTTELGKIFSFISAIQAFLPFLASPLYTVVYRLTLSTFPGFFNILNANLYILTICLVFKKKNTATLKLLEENTVKVNVAVNEKILPKAK